MNWSNDRKPSVPALGRRASAVHEAALSGRDMASRWRSATVSPSTRAICYDKFVEIERLAVEIIEELAK